MVINLFEKLSNNYIELFEKEEDLNVIINVGEHPNAKEFKAYSGILKYRSRYFQNELTNAVNNTKGISRING
ncbi:serine-enriched protein [Gigaspora margarita]|uniref:Serine-enriched protein n=1 Tax=Gigaspora margarita TaxID=4874 RepID=A0A8H4AIC7_GIGMA|nr:serine-enriched protein [Gigaspora margarita]